jgi:peptidoglycan/xylan/chitin deacetylase (PgdA/CDA1 family)
VKAWVVIHDDRAQPEAAYVLETLLDLTGLPHQICANEIPVGLQQGLVLHYGEPRSDAVHGIVIPADDPELWSGAVPAFAMLDGVPVLCAGELPLALYSWRGELARLSFDLVRATFWLLSRQEELDGGRRDRFGRFDDSSSWLIRHGLARVPIVDLYARLLARLAQECARHLGLPLLRTLHWPSGRRYAVVLSHDVDDAGRFSPRQGLHLLRKAMAQGSPRGVLRGAYYGLAGLGHSLSRRPDPYWNFDAVMDLEASAGFRSTFFFVSDARSADRDPPYEVDTGRLRDLLKRLRGGGWEVGVHGSFDSYLQPDLLRAQREKLERVSCGSVHGVRQHYLRLQIPGTFRAQAEAGFVYDGSLGYRGAIGFRSGAAFPFHPYDQDARKPLALLELPLTVMDGPLFWQLRLTPAEATRQTLALLDTVRSVGGLAVLLWHQRTWHEKRYPGWHQVFAQAVEHLRHEGLAWVATAGQVADWWHARKRLHLVETALTSGEWHWRFQAGQAVRGLTLDVAGSGWRLVSAEGASVSSRTAGTSIWLEFQSLDADQQFEVVLAPERGSG